MTFLMPTKSYNSRHYAPACLALLLSCFISVLHVYLPGGAVSLLLLPMLIVSLWPRGVNAVMTIVTFCLIGIFMDWGTHGTLGQWALTYLAIFAVLRPDRRENPVRFIGAAALWAMGLLIGTVMLIVTGWLVYGVLPNFAVLFRQAILVSALMPFVIMIRNMVRFFLMDPNDRDYL